LGPNGASVAGLAARGGTLLAVSSRAGAFVSHDAADHWRLTAPGPTGARPISPAHVAGDGTLYVVDDDAELWRSRDDGATWGSLREAAVAAGAPATVTDLDRAAARTHELAAVFAANPFRS